MEAKRNANIKDLENNSKVVVEPPQHEQQEFLEQTYEGAHALKPRENSPIIFNPQEMKETRIRRLRDRSLRFMEYGERLAEKFSSEDSEVVGVSMLTPSVDLSNRNARLNVAKSPDDAERNPSQRLADLPHELQESRKMESESFLPGLEKNKRFFQILRKKMKKLENALNLQQVFLFERHADILQLRMEIVNTMMKFQAESKAIKEEISRFDKSANLFSLGELHVSSEMMKNQAQRCFKGSVIELVSKSSSSSSSFDSQRSRPDTIMSTFDEEQLRQGYVTSNEPPKNSEAEEPEGGKISFRSTSTSIDTPEPLIDGQYHVCGTPAKDDVLNSSSSVENIESAKTRADDGDVVNRLEEWSEQHA